ncbi:MAG: preprotein translocase subunit SecE [candidate division Zixibacteria bacterium]|nr:preprotein translocase subunit SecE [candidate division Zixibacteria bacterium]
MKEKIRTYLKETIAELRQVTWPSKTELVGSTIVTVVFTLVLAVFIYAVDKTLETIIFSILSLRG